MMWKYVPFHLEVDCISLVSFIMMKDLWKVMFTTKLWSAFNAKVGTQHLFEVPKVGENVCCYNQFNKNYLVCTTWNQKPSHPKTAIIANELTNNSWSWIELPLSFRAELAQGCHMLKTSYLRKDKQQKPWKNHLAKTWKEFCVEGKP